MKPFQKLETFFNHLAPEGYHECVQAGLFDFHERTIPLLKNSKILQNDSQIYIQFKPSNIPLLHKSWPQSKQYMPVTFSITKSRNRWHHTCQQLSKRKYTSSVDNIRYCGNSYYKNHSLLEEDHYMGDSKSLVTQALNDGIQNKKRLIGKRKKYIKRNDGTKELVTSNDTTRHLEICLNRWNTYDDVAVTKLH